MTKERTFADKHSTESNQTEQRLEAPSTRLIDAGIGTIHDMETPHACVTYENASQNRVQILRRLAQRAQEIQS